MKIDTSQDHRPAGTSAKSCGKVSESHYPHALLLFDDVEISLMLRGISNPERSDRSSPRIDDRKLDAPDKIELFWKQCNFNPSSMFVDKTHMLQSLPSVTAGPDEPHGGFSRSKSYRRRRSVRLRTQYSPQMAPSITDNFLFCVKKYLKTRIIPLRTTSQT